MPPPFTPGERPGGAGHGDAAAAKGDGLRTQLVAPSSDSSPAARRLLYQDWPGNNRFCCSGHLMMGPRHDWPYNLCAWASILVPSACYFRASHCVRRASRPARLFLVSVLTRGLPAGFVAPLLWEHTTWLPLFSAYMLASTLLCLSLTSYTDPGYLPRQEQLGPGLGQGIQRRFVTQEGPQLFTWCKTCKIWRPPKAHHCS